VAQRQRSDEIDLWRGFVLLTIFVNHIPGNLIEHLTHRNLGFSDGAEPFVFLAGVSLAIAYGPKFSTEGFLAVARRCFRRAGQLYRTHLLLTAAFVAALAIIHLASGLDRFLATNGTAAVFGDTPRGVVGLVTMSYQIGYLNILPLYVVLMLWAPVALALARLHVAAALGASLLVYVAARYFGLALPNWPEPDAWFFNPFAWQFLLTLGIVAGLTWRERPVPLIRPLLTAALVYLGASAFVQTDGLGFFPGLHHQFYATFDLLKTDLALLRLLHFLALAYALTQVPVARLLGSTRVGRALAGLGRHGLPVFVAGTVLSLAGQLVMSLLEESHSGAVQVVGLGVTVVGAGCLFLLVRYREWTPTDSARLARAWRSRGSFAWSQLQPYRSFWRH
jgi:hypothetical protein